MKSSIKKKIFCAAALMGVFPVRLLCQGLDPATIANPPADSWPSYHGDYSGKRHSSLTAITPQNVGSLTLAWAFQTGQESMIKSSPLLVNGVLYFTVPDNVWAVDARTGRQIWHYTYKPNEGMHLGHRGVAMYTAMFELIAAVTALKAPVSLQTRVGIATGLVVVGDLIGSGAAQEQAVVGETPNVAARLQSMAEPNTVVIAESTRNLFGGLF